MPEIKIIIKFHLPKCIYRLRVLLVLAYRRLKYGYPFRKIHLTQGKFAIVDPEDYERLSKYKWYAAKNGRSFYAQRNIGWQNGRRPRYTIQMHRQILNAPKNKIIDHINHNGLDNRKANLRFVTTVQNTWNTRKRLGNYTSKYKGVSFHKRDRIWQVDILCDGRKSYLGSFENEQAAAKAYDEKAKELFGRYAVLNFPM